MDEDWTAPILIKDDCLFSAVACGSSMLQSDFCCGIGGDDDSSSPSSGFLSPSGTQHILDALSQRDLCDFGFHLGTSTAEICGTGGGSASTLSAASVGGGCCYSINVSDFPSLCDVKSEPRDEGSNSDYTASFSQSQSCSPCSSSLSSTDQEARDATSDLQFSQETQNGLLGSPLAIRDGGSGRRADVCASSQLGFRARELHTLPPVSQFSASVRQHTTFDPSQAASDRLESPSPPSSSDRSSPMEPAVHLGTANAFKARSKMHEMAVKQRLITDQDPRGSGFVQLSAEEKRTLIQEGYSLPTRLPLSKSEEEALKIVRRKIKNKLSAQESRRKRKEYMDTLELRVQGYFSENSSLKAKVKQLEQSNRNLVLQLKKLQAALGAHNSSQPPPCLSAQLPLPSQVLS